MPRAKKSWPEKTVAGVVTDYKSGTKTAVIEYEYKLGPGDLYKILREAKVALRKPRPSLPTPPPAVDQTKELRQRVAQLLRLHLESRLQDLADKNGIRPCFLDIELTRLADHSSEIEIQDCLDRCEDLLLTCLEAEPTPTVKYLGYATEPFSPEDLINAVMYKFIDKVLATMPDEIEQVGPGLWRLKGAK